MIRSGALVVWLIAGGSRLRVDRPACPRPVGAVVRRACAGARRGRPPPRGRGLQPGDPGRPRGAAADRCPALPGRSQPAAVRGGRGRGGQHPAERRGAELPDRRRARQRPAHPQALQQALAPRGLARGPQPGLDARLHEPVPPGEAHRRARACARCGCSGSRTCWWRPSRPARRPRGSTTAAWRASTTVATPRCSASTARCRARSWRAHSSRSTARTPRSTRSPSPSLDARNVAVTEKRARRVCRSPPAAGPAGSARIVTYEPDRVTIDANLTRPRHRGARRQLVPGLEGEAGRQAGRRRAGRLRPARNGRGPRPPPHRIPLPAGQLANRLDRELAGAPGPVGGHTLETPMEDWTYQEHYDMEDRHWWFRSRRRVIWALIHRAQPPAAPRILDAGCGTGRNLDGFPETGRPPRASTCPRRRSSSASGAACTACARRRSSSCPTRTAASTCCSPPT